MAYAEASVTHWPAADITRLQQVLHQGQVMLVVFDGCELKPLWQCTQANPYEFREGPGEQSVQQSASQFVGQFVATDFDAAAPRTADCAAATHLIVAADVGAFERESPEGQQSFGCRTQECAAPLSVTLNPLRAAKTPLTCSQGEVLEDGRCVKPSSPTLRCDEGFVLRDGQCVRELCVRGIDPTTGGCRVAPATDLYYAPDAETRGLIESIAASTDSVDRVKRLLSLIERYRKEQGRAEADLSRQRALIELINSPAFKGHREELARHRELVLLSSTVGERWMHLDAANQMLKRFPDAPESGIAYIAIARYYCAQGQPAAAERFYVQMRENVKKLEPADAKEIAAVRASCRAKAAD
jgi:hypothetical protein